MFLRAPSAPQSFLEPPSTPIDHSTPIGLGGFAKRKEFLLLLRWVAPSPWPGAKNSTAEKNGYLLLLKLQDRLWTLPDSPRGHPGSIWKSKNKFEKTYVWAMFFHSWRAASQNRPFNNINRCWEPFNLTLSSYHVGTSSRIPVHAQTRCYISLCVCVCVCVQVFDLLVHFCICLYFFIYIF